LSHASWNLHCGKGLDLLYWPVLASHYWTVHRHKRVAVVGMLRWRALHILVMLSCAVRLGHLHYMVNWAGHLSCGPGIVYTLACSGSSVVWPLVVPLGNLRSFHNSMPPSGGHHGAARYHHRGLSRLLKGVSSHREVILTLTNIHLSLC